MRRRLKVVIRAAAWGAGRCDDVGGWSLGVLRRIERGGGMTRTDRIVIGVVHAVILGTGIGLVWWTGRGIGWW